MSDQLRIYGFRDSHPVEAALAAAKYKRVDFKFVPVAPAIHRLTMPPITGSNRVPGARLGKRRVPGSTAIFHLLDELEPERPLFPADPELRTRVEAAERWAEGDVQDIGRRLVWGHLSRSPETVKKWSMQARPGIKRTVMTLLAPAMAQIAKVANSASDDNVKADLAALPGILDEIDRLIDEQTICGEQPNAADFQVLANVGIWMNMADLRPLLIDRPCGQAAAELFPTYTGRVPSGLLPAEWFDRLREGVPSPA